MAKKKMSGGIDKEIIRVWMGTKWATYPGSRTQNKSGDSVCLQMTFLGAFKIICGEKETIFEDLDKAVDAYNYYIGE